MSGADTQSNPSDFDFADMQQEEDIEEVTVMVKNLLNNKKSS